MCVCVCVFNLSPLSRGMLLFQTELQKALCSSKWKLLSEKNRINSRCPKTENNAKGKN